MKNSFERLRAALRGITGFGVTPFHSDFSPNEEALRKNAEALAESCDVVVALGNNGEIFSQSFEEQLRVGRAVVEEVEGGGRFWWESASLYQRRGNSPSPRRNTLPRASWLYHLT